MSCLSDFQKITTESVAHPPEIIKPDPSIPDLLTSLFNITGFTPRARPTIVVAAERGAKKGATLDEPTTCTNPTTTAAMPTTTVHKQIPCIFAAGLRRADTPLGQWEGAFIYAMTPTGQLLPLTVDGFDITYDTKDIMTTYATETRLLVRQGWRAMSRDDLTHTAAKSGVVIGPYTGMLSL